MPDPALGIGDTAVNKTSHGAQVLWGKTDNSLPEGDECCREKGSCGKSAGK